MEEINVIQNYINNTKLMYYKIILIIQNSQKVLFNNKFALTCSGVILMLNLIIIIVVIKKNCPTRGSNLTQPDPRGLGWVGLNPCDGLG